MSELRLVVDPPRSGAENMRIDGELLRLCAAGGVAGAVRIYSFSPPCLSLGRMQDAADVDAAACARDGIDVVRRPSGGRAVLHDHEVTYAIVCSASDPDLGGRVLDSCARIHEAIAAGLARLGVPTTARTASADERDLARSAARVADCFAKPSAHELLDLHGRKLVGSAQARFRGALLQHGSVMLRPHRASSYLMPPVVDSRSSSLEELLGRPLSRDEVVAALLGGLRARLGPRLAAAAESTTQATA